VPKTALFLTLGLWRVRVCFILFTTEAAVPPARGRERATGSGN